MAIQFITGNAGKFAEAKAIIPDLEQVSFDLLEIQSLDSKKIIGEKLREAQKHHQGEFIVEDTSLSVVAMKGLPGPLVKWFQDTIGNHGIHQIAATYPDQTAIAKTVIGYSNPEGEIRYFEGEVKGKIVAPSDAVGFGWDQIFQPDGYDKTFGEMGKEEKNKISMRRLAFEKLKIFLNQ